MDCYQSIIYKGGGGAYGWVADWYLRRVMHFVYMQRRLGVCGMPGATETRLSRLADNIPLTRFPPQRVHPHLVLNRAPPSITDSNQCLNSILRNMSKVVLGLSANCLLLVEC